MAVSLAVVVESTVSVAVVVMGGAYEGPLYSTSGKSWPLVTEGDSPTTASEAVVATGVSLAAVAAPVPNIGAAVATEARRVRTWGKCIVAM